MDQWSGFFPDLKTEQCLPRAMERNLRIRNFTNSCTGTILNMNSRATNGMTCIRMRKQEKVSKKLRPNMLKNTIKIWQAIILITVKITAARMEYSVGSII